MILVLLVTASAASGQGTPPTSDYRVAFTRLQARDTIRVWSRDPELRGAQVAVERLSSASVAVTTDGSWLRDGKRLDLPGPNLLRVDKLYRVPASTKGELGSAVGGFFKGGLIGGALGATVGYLVVSDHADNDVDDSAMGAAMIGTGGFLVGGFVGFVRGMIVGSGPRKVWEPVLRTR